MTQQPLEWQFCDTDAAIEWPSETASGQFVPEDAAGSAQAVPRSSSKMHYLYELICAIALLYAISVYLLWQQAAARITAMEREVAALHNEIVALPQKSAEDALATTNGKDMGTVETTYLRFVVSLDLLTSVTRIASSIDANYQRLHRDFNLSLPVAGEKLNIVIIPVSHTGDSARRLYQPTIEEEQLLIVYPQSAAKLNGISPDEALSAELLVRLSQRLFGQAVGSRLIKPQWQGTVMALRTYIQVTHGSKRNRQWDDRLLLDRYNAQHYSLTSVHDIIHESAGASEQWSQPGPTAYATAHTLVEFILVTYGNDSVPLLLDAFAEHDSWETLTPALFHLSADEFEEEWHAYLRRHYPIPAE